MFGKISRPKWWLLFLLMPVLVKLFVIDYEAPISDAGHRVLEVGIVLLVFGLIELWLRGNDANIRAAQWHAAQGRETRRVLYTSQGQFVTIKKADPQSASVTPARIMETAPVKRSPKPTALTDNTVLEPVGSLSSLLSKSAPYANSKALAVLGFVTRRS